MLPDTQADGHDLGQWHIAFPSDRRNGANQKRISFAKLHHLGETQSASESGCRTFTHSTELVYWAAKAQKGDRPNYVFNYADMKAENGGKQLKTVWQYTAAGRQEKRYGKHPTQKPVALIERCIRASTAPDDLVLDPFSGTASTGVAALNMGRRFVGIEVEQEFVDIGLKRLKDFDTRLFGSNAKNQNPSRYENSDASSAIVATQIFDKGED